MGRYTKEKFIISDQDSLTIIGLKTECNTLIDAFNSLNEPLSEQGQELSSQINFYVTKINGLKDSNFDKGR